jgi:hypothetical protein
MDNIILERLKKAKIVVNEKEKVIEVSLDVGTDGDDLLVEGATIKTPNPNFRKWREGNVRRHLKSNGYAYGACLEGPHSGISNTQGNNVGYWKYELRAVKSATTEKKDVNNENTKGGNTEPEKPKKPRKRRAKK